MRNTPNGKTKCAPPLYAVTGDLAVDGSNFGEWVNFGDSRVAAGLTAMYPAGLRAFCN